MWKATFLKSHCCHFLLCCLFFLICSNLGIKTQNNRTENRTKTSSKKKKNYKCLCVCFYYEPTTSWQTLAMLLSGTLTSRWKSCPASEARLRYTAGWWAQIRLTARCVFVSVTPFVFWGHKPETTFFFPLQLKEEICENCATWYRHKP